jgi:hypothetical protein
LPNVIPDHKGFGTMLKPTAEKKSRAPKGSDQLESFISDMEEHLIELALDPNNKYKPNERAKEIQDIAKQVSDQYHFIVPTDKTNSFSVMPTEEYKQKVLRHLLKDGKEISRERLILAQEQAEELLEDIDRLCSKGERDFIQESLKSKAIPSPKLLIKDHKKKDKWGNFPTRLVIPATNFTSAFPKLGYMGIKKIFDDEKVNYMKKTIVQASHAKGILEKLFINKSSHTVFSLDIKSFYPSVTYYRHQLLRRQTSDERKTNDSRMLEMYSFWYG